MSTNTTKSIGETSGTMNEKIEASLAKAKEKVSKEKQVSVSIPKSFKKSIGETLYLAINGVGIVLPVDGTKHSVPQSFADHLQDYLNNLTA